MAHPQPVHSVGDLLAVALVIERAAAARYVELARRMAERELDELADLFTRLGRLERDHARFLERRLAGQPLPVDAGAAGTESIDLDANEPLTPHGVLLAALRSEERAKAHFERIAAAAEAPSVRRFAAEMAADEAEHIDRIAAALALHPGPDADWNDPRAAAAARVLGD
jgi:rubrerythrin